MELAGVLSDGFADEMELAAPLDVPFGGKVHDAMSLDDDEKDEDAKKEYQNSSLRNSDTNLSRLCAATTLTESAFTSSHVNKFGICITTSTRG